MMLVNSSDSVMIHLALCNCCTMKNQSVMAFSNRRLCVFSLQDLRFRHSHSIFTEHVSDICLE